MPQLQSQSSAAKKPKGPRITCRHKFCCSSSARVLITHSDYAGTMLSTQIYACRGSLLTHTIPGFSRAGLEQRLHSQALEISLRRKSCTAEANTLSPLYFFKLENFLLNCTPDFFLFSSSFPARFPGFLQSLCCSWCHTQPLLSDPFQQPPGASTQQPGEDPEQFPVDLQREHGGGWQHEALE